MASFFKIIVGYNTFGNTSLNLIKKIAENITIKEMRQKAIELNALDITHRSELEEYLLSYKKIPTDDLSVRFFDDSISLMASGNGKHRKLRELLCRSFGLLVLEKSFAKGYSVNFNEI